jgi:hypothetical protein
MTTCQTTPAPNDTKKSQTVDLVRFQKQVENDFTGGSHEAGPCWQRYHIFVREVEEALGKSPALGLRRHFSVLPCD